MASRIEDYALVSNCHTAALISDEGSIDWLCLPRLDSPSIFGALFGTRDEGCWQLRPADPRATHSRRYSGETMLLVTRWECQDGVAEVHDLLVVNPQRGVDHHRVDLVRRIVGISGQVRFEQSVRLRFDYARALPWVRQGGTADAPELVAMAGPDAVVLHGALMDRLCGLTNDVGMLSEEYDVAGAHQAGNTPQAFSHLTLVRAADALERRAHRTR